MGSQMYNEPSLVFFSFFLPLTMESMNQKQDRSTANVRESTHAALLFAMNFMQGSSLALVNKRFDSLMQSGPPFPSNGYVQHRGH